MRASSSTKSAGSSSNGDDGKRQGQSTWPRTRRESPSPNQIQYNRDVLPEPFIEAIVIQVAIDAARRNGRISAASAVLNLFQVCSTWWAVSRSESLWKCLTRRVWAPRCLLSGRTWRQEFIFRHRTAANFCTGTYHHMMLSFDPTQVDEPTGFICRCLVLSENRMACGFADGSVRVFHLPTGRHAATFRPYHRSRLGPFSRAVSDILISDAGLVFATVDGDIHTVVFGGAEQPRRAVSGDVFSNGVLVGFSGNNRWWVGLYAGVPGRSFHVWDAETEREVYVGGSLTDDEAVLGWHQLNELTRAVGRVRMTGDAAAVGCTRRGAVVLRMSEGGEVTQTAEMVAVAERRLIVETVDVAGGLQAAVENGGVAVLREVGTMEEVCRLGVGRLGGTGVMGCLNSGHLALYEGGVIKMWEAEAGRHGRLVCTLGEMVGEGKALVANDRHVAACNSDSSIHLWDFGAQ